MSHKTYFISGPVQVYKTYHALRIVENASDVYTLKPSSDTVSKNIHTKSGLLQDRSVDRYIGGADDLDFMDGVVDKIVVVDEATFLTAKQLECIYEASSRNRLTIITSLDMTFNCKQWEGYKWWIENVEPVETSIYDDIDQINSLSPQHMIVHLKVDCRLCGAQNCATLSKLININKVIAENSICPGGSDTFAPVCKTCHES